MKLLVIFAAAVVAAPLCLASLPERIQNSPEGELWKQWKSVHNKKYDSEVEEIHRFNIWVGHLKNVEEHNIRHDLGLETFKAAMTSMTDLSFQEFQATYLGLIKSGEEVTNVRDLPTKEDLPSYVDWRTQGYVTGVKNQGSCGSCWTFSTTGCIEGQHFNQTGSLVSLSEQQLVDCDGGNYGCNGGWPYDANKYVIKYGLESEASYPYYGYASRCHYSSSKVVARVSHDYYVRSGDEGALKTASAMVGPIEVCVEVSGSFQYYNGGVYYNPNCQNRVNHAVLVVGYGTDPNYGDYWIVKNSWGPNWGAKGYIYMARNRNNNCGIASYASYATA